ncbi:hypothetical protein NBO_18g0013 [Nosema bombycis CQ1]|uniref:Ras-GEF domain-containing protein n=1 Tax=Nosema bombycis (strain CQ1 / CVCC 102059) TaxID=578461 RepID=R0KUY1_NOSB1|nr:hypothetical protein NBO_18g0013 [Nosema bombycis CQ1]|eukprot:EOB14686.1 hypothetical protein NBO_18g0013 [Nosema bombycis CQ1]
MFHKIDLLKPSSLRMNEADIIELLKRCYGPSEFKTKVSQATTPQEDNNLEETKDLNETYWSHTVLPDSFYLFNIKRGNKLEYYKYKACKSEESNLFDIKPRKLARLLTDLDILLIMKINPSELVDYDGVFRENEHLNLNYMKNKNRGLINFLSSLMKNSKTHRYLLKVMKHLKNLKNLNSLECFSKAFRNQRLKTEELSHLSAIEEDINTYFVLRQTVDCYHEKGFEFIYPFDLFLKDVEDSNLNINQEDASMRFCRLMEMLVGLQNNVYTWGPDNEKENIKKRFKHKYEHFLLFYASKWLNVKTNVVDNRLESNEGIFLFL